MAQSPGENGSDMVQPGSNGIQHGGYQGTTSVPGYARGELYAGTFTGSIVNVGLLERLQEVLDDTGWTAKEWAVRANLAEPTHLYTSLRRLKAKPDHQLDVTTLAALADAAGVTLDWLALGRLPKLSARGAPDPKYPSRSQAIAAARFMGIPEAAIARVATVDDLPLDPGTENWMQRLLLAANELRASQLLLPPGPDSGAERHRQ